MECITAEWFRELTSGRRPWVCEVVLRYSLRTRNATRKTALNNAYKDGDGDEGGDDDDDDDDDDLINTLCASSSSPSTASSGGDVVVVTALHDGLGNQMFQAAFGSLLLHDLQRDGGATNHNKKRARQRRLVLLDVASLGKLSPDSKSGRSGPKKLNRSSGASALLWRLFPALRRESVFFGAASAAPEQRDAAVETCVGAIRSSLTPAAPSGAAPTVASSNVRVIKLSDKRGSGSGGFVQQFRPLSYVRSDGNGAGDDSPATECVFVDGFFQDPFLYERSRDQVKRLFRMTVEEQQPRSQEELDSFSSSAPAVRHPMLDALEKWSTASGDFDEERGKQQKMQQTEKKQKTVDSKEDDKEEKRRSARGGGGGGGGASGGGVLRVGSSREAVVHLRTCEGNRGGINSRRTQDLSRSFYPSLPVSYFREALGGPRRHTWDVLWIVAPVRSKK